MDDNRTALRRIVRVPNIGDSDNSLHTMNSLHVAQEERESDVNNSKFIELDDWPGTRKAKLQKKYRFENTIEVKVDPGDTLQALALRYHCPIPVIKRLNKIDKENEIFARTVIKIPVTVHNVLIGQTDIQPAIHKSGNNSPVHAGNNEDIQNPLDNARKVLQEKLLVASVNASNELLNDATNAGNNEVNRVILNSKLSPNASVTITTDSANTTSHDFDAPLLDDPIANLRPIPVPGLVVFDWPGADCGMTWVCLVLVTIMLFVIPIIYVIYIAEHPTHHHSNNNN